MKNENKAFCFIKLDPKKFSINKVKKVISHDTNEGILNSKEDIDIYENDDGSTAVYIPMDRFTSNIAMLDLLSDLEVENPPHLFI